MPAAEDSQIYRDLMRFKPEGLSANAWAVKAGVSRTVWSDMRRHGNPSRRTLEKLLTAAGSSLAEFEALRVGTAPESLVEGAAGVGEGPSRGWKPAAPQPLPLLRSAAAGEWGSRRGIGVLEIHRREIIDRLPRPPSLAADTEAYAITVVGDSMWPRFRPGRRVAVSPQSAAGLGDDVLVILKGERSVDASRAILMELVEGTSTGLKLRQFNPDTQINVSSAEIEAIHKICGELI